MSDSDDTDTLLLIPPNYYLQTVEQQLQQQRIEQQLWLQQQQANQQLFDATVQQLNEQMSSIMFQQQQQQLEQQQLMLQDQAKNRNELNQHNLSLHNSYLAAHECSSQHPFVVPPLSELSTICSSNEKSNRRKSNSRSDALMCSTPKLEHSISSLSLCTNSSLTAIPALRKPTAAKDNVLQEIDEFLIDKQIERNCSKLKNDNRDKLDDMNLQMLSLSDMWRHDEAVSTTATPAGFKEEQLRRQHLQKTVHTLQARLLEYQQRLSVAIAVDRSKNDALTATQAEHKSLQAELQQWHKMHQQLQEEHAECVTKLNNMQKELTQAVNLAAKFEERNEKLQHELNDVQKKQHNELQQMREQLEELEIKYQVSKKTEENALNDVGKLKEKFLKIEHQHDKYKVRCDELEKENIMLRSQKSNLQEFHLKQKMRADALEERGKSLQDAIQKLSENETSLVKKIETQQKILKNQYQQQLDHVVTQKLREFQNQLDENEQRLKQEARERERMMAERAVKQLEMMNEKNEQELQLLQQKNSKEVELYRIQLANAAQRIEKLEGYLNCYRSRRTEIAEQLHGVMEAQWQKALEILISPAHLQNSPNANDNNLMQQQSMAGNSTPKSAKLRLFSEHSHSADSKDNNLNELLYVQKELEPEANLKNAQNDILQSYIDLLLSKSPNDFAKLDELLNANSNKTCDEKKLAKYAQKKQNNKPPWKS